MRTAPGSVGISGLSLSRALYQRAVKPILDRDYPSVDYAAALVGWDSEVLGYDTVRSRDHEWGPRLLLFVRDAELPDLGPRIDQSLADHLPHEIDGFPTSFNAAGGVRRMTRTIDGAVAHAIHVYSVRSFGLLRLGVDVTEPCSSLGWLTIPQQRLLELVGGEVFHDGVGELTAARSRYTYFPDDVWRYILACQWQRIAQEEAFVGRASEVGDELGSRLVAARLIRDLIRLCLAMERRYWPYSKWLCSAFSSLPVAAVLRPVMDRALAVSGYGEREASLTEAYAIVAARHNELGLTETLDPAVLHYFSRPYLVLHAARFAEALRATIKDPAVRALALVGSTDQFTDSTDIVERPELAALLREIYSGD
jgi:hypothetical protein